MLAHASAAMRLRRGAGAARHARGGGVSTRGRNAEASAGWQAATAGRTGGRTDGRTDGKTDGRTDTDGMDDRGLTRASAEGKWESAMEGCASTGAC